MMVSAYSAFLAFSVWCAWNILVSNLILALIVWCCCGVRHSGHGFGVLFTHWLVAAGSWKTRGLMRHLPLSQQDRNDIIRVEGPHWLFFVIKTLCHRGKTCGLQLFFGSMVLQFRGLSRHGSGFSAALGITQKRTTYRRFEAAFVETQKDKIRWGLCDD